MVIQNNVKTWIATPRLAKTCRERLCEPQRSNPALFRLLPNFREYKNGYDLFWTKATQVAFFIGSYKNKTPAGVKFLYEPMPRNGHELLTIIVRFSPILVSTLDPVSPVAKRHGSDFQFWTRVKQFTLCIGSRKKDP